MQWLIIVVELLQMEVLFVSPHPGQIRLPEARSPSQRSPTSLSLLTGVPLVSSRLWPLLLGHQPFQWLCAHVELDWRRGLTGLEVFSSTGMMTLAEHGHCVCVWYHQWCDSPQSFTLYVGVFVLKLFLKSTTKSPSLQTPGACVRTVDVLLRSRVPFYGNSSAGSSSNVQEQQHQGTMRFWIKSLFLTNILRLYMFTLYWCWSLKAEVRYLLSLRQQGH